MSTALRDARPLGRDPARTHGRSAVLLVLAVGALALRGLVALALPAVRFDADVYRSWARTLATVPWSEFYGRADGPDHLPGDVLLHGVLARCAAAAGASLTSPAYGLALKAVPVVADVVVAACAYALVAPRRGARAGLRAGVAVLWCPATWLVSAWWGQWDAVGAALVLLGTVTLDRLPARRAPGVALLAWACLVKPQLALAAGPLVLDAVLRGPCRARADAVITAAVVALGTGQLLCLPFGVSVLGQGPGSLAGRVAFAADRFDAMTLGAPNVWAFVERPWASDARLMGPVSAHGLGLALLAVALVATTRRWWLLRTGDALVAALWWATCNLAVFYLVMTRCHERYLVPAVLFGVVLAALDRRFALPVGLLALVCTATLLHSLAGLGSGAAEPWCFRAAAVVLASAVPLLGARARQGSGPRARPRPDRPAQR